MNRSMILATAIAASGMHLSGIVASETAQRALDSAPTATIYGSPVWRRRTFKRNARRQGKSCNRV